MVEKGIFRRARGLLVPVLVGSTLLGACSDDTDEAASTGPITQATVSTIDSYQIGSDSVPAGTVSVTFDNLGGGDEAIKVYPGPLDNPVDRKWTGTAYLGGDVVEAECLTLGREVVSDPAAGEREKNSSFWVRILGPGAAPLYATVVYLKDPQLLSDRLPRCNTE